jgi:hypothetical protein
MDNRDIVIICLLVANGISAYQFTWVKQEMRFQWETINIALQGAFGPRPYRAKIWEDPYAP